MYRLNFQSQCVNFLEQYTESKSNLKKEDAMAVFKCEKCGATKEGRCKPKKCPECTEAGTMQKQEEKKSSGCGCACK